jgi:carbonic anhydrase
MFILRNVGNFVPPYNPDNDYHGSSAAIEYAVNVLNVKHIIVCGHSHCGA